MHAVRVDGVLVGDVSLGVHILPEYRRRDFAKAAQRAKGLGFKLLNDQVYPNNIASIHLYELPGLETDAYAYSNRK